MVHYQPFDDQDNRKGQPVSLVALAPSLLQDEFTETVYFGCSEDDLKGYLNLLTKFCRCEDIYINTPPKYLEDFEREIVVKDLQASTNSNALGLDYLIDNQLEKHYQINFDQYNWYNDGSMPM
ncbi:MAG: hypothetical protein QNJ54_01590 [Prochloraceae cyanobacterium]|nr:hypothetical protein [Prochloraceae cyanobacterium]